MVRGLVVLGAVAVLVALLWAATWAQQGATCEVCMEIDGRRACRSATASDRRQAQQHAVATACAVLTAGVTADLACQRTPPATLRCE